MKIAILTATHNHPDKLMALYQSLKKQNNKEFLWCIIDDGSDQSTDGVIKKIIKDSGVNIRAYRKKNGGKMKAINYGLNKLSDYKFITFVDDDEILFPKSVDIINDYYEKYKDTSVGMIHFNRSDETGNIIANWTDDNDLIMSNQERKKSGYTQDGYTGYFVSKLGNLRTPEFKNENYIGPSVLFMLLSKKHDILWANSNTILGKTEYLSDGITRQGRSLRVKNPKGMYVYCLLRQHKDSGIILRWVYSVYGYAYLNYNNLKEADVRKELNNYNEKLISAAKPFSRILTLYWKIKFS